ncbi:MAG: hypothetical protein IJR99_02730 [Kiritimatiellae bacterium]|nr:hypothetical protein [Kiritimatiellia bacterium]
MILPTPRTGGARPVATETDGEGAVATQAGAAERVPPSQFGQRGRCPSRSPQKRQECRFPEQPATVCAEGACEDNNWNNGWTTGEPSRFKLF